MQIDAILSDYDGTLCPTTSINHNQDVVQLEIENALWQISDMIPVCIVSSKDFNFLHRRTRYASIISCIMGIETLVLQRHKVMKVSSEQSELEILSESSQCQNQDCIKESFLSAQNENLQHTSVLLYRLAEIVRENFDEIHIEQKFTATNSRILAGITIDWRETKDWKLFKINSEPQLKKMITQKQKVDPERSNVLIQTYSTHPFIDIYSTKCDKGMAYDQIISMITTSKKRQLNIIYLGDSENDNPAFRKATVPIGIQSDSRLKPNLDCSYYLHISKLSIFLKSLISNNLEFSQNLIAI